MSRRFMARRSDSNIAPSEPLNRGAAPHPLKPEQVLRVFFHTRNFRESVPMRETEVVRNKLVLWWIGHNPNRVSDSIINAVRPEPPNISPHDQGFSLVRFAEWTPRAYTH